MTAHREPPNVAILSARIARAFPTLSAYSAATLADDLGRIERAQHRHAERCCNGSDGGYVKLQLDKRPSAHGTDVLIHDPAAEERAGKRIERSVLKWKARVQTLVLGDDADPVTVRQYCYAGAPCVELQHDPRGHVLLLRLPGEAEAVSV